MKDESEYLNDNGMNVSSNDDIKKTKNKEDHDENDAVKLSSIPVSIFDPMVWMLVLWLDVCYME